jgi:hypothetical protein
MTLGVSYSILGGALSRHPWRAVIHSRSSASRRPLRGDRESPLDRLAMDGY